MEYIIQTEKLTKYYGDLCAVSNLDLNIRKGEIYGFIGLNGAGKTTTIRMLLGMIRPDSGEAWLNGKQVSPARTDIWKKVGYMVEIPYAYPFLSVRENLEITRRIRLLKDRKLVDNVIENLGLTPYKNIKARKLSHGNAQRLGLAKAMMHKPEILILDEPTNGLDPAGIYEIRELLKELVNYNGVTIFISSHILDEIARFTTRIGIIHSGRIIKEIQTTQLDELCSRHLCIDTGNREAAMAMLQENKYRDIQIRDNLVYISDEKAINDPARIASLLVNHGLPPSRLKVEEENLESYFLRTIRMEGGVK